MYIFLNRQERCFSKSHWLRPDSTICPNVGPVLVKNFPGLLLDVTLQCILLRHVGVPCVMLVPPISPPPPYFGVAEFKNEGFTRGWATLSWSQGLGGLNIGEVQLAVTLRCTPTPSCHPFPS